MEAIEIEETNLEHANLTRRRSSSNFNLKKKEGFVINISFFSLSNNY
jgi:hypothetical protein